MNILNNDLFNPFGVEENLCYYPLVKPEDSNIEPLRGFVTISDVDTCINVFTNSDVETCF